MIRKKEGFSQIPAIAYYNPMKLLFRTKNIAFEGIPLLNV